MSVSGCGCINIFFNEEKPHSVGHLCTGMFLSRYLSQAEGVIIRAQGLHRALTRVAGLWSAMGGIR